MVLELVDLGKGKVFPLQALVAQRVGRGLTLLFHDRRSRRGWVVSVAPRPLYTPEKDTVLIVHEAGWTPGRSRRVENLVPTGIRSRNVQAVVSRCTDWATGLTAELGNFLKQ